MGDSGPASRGGRVAVKVSVVYGKSGKTEDRMSQDMSS